MASKKRVSIDMFQEEVSAYDEYMDVPVVFNDDWDKEYTIRLFPYFKPERVRDLVKELSVFFRNADKEKLEIPQNEENDLVGFFILKYFTDLKFTRSKKAEKIYEEFKIAINTNMFKKLLESFPEESVKKVYGYVHETVQVGANLQEKMKDLKLENREIIEQLVAKRSQNIRNVLAD